MREKDEELTHSLSPSTEFLCHDEDFQRENFDPYLRRIDEEPDPEQVTKAGSRWQTALHFLFGLGR